MSALLALLLVPHTAVGLDRYFHHENVINGALVGVGAGAVGAGAWLVSTGDERAVGAGWAIASVGAIQLGTGAGFLVYSQPKWRELAAQVAADPDGYHRAERARMEAVVAPFDIYYGVEALALTVAVALWAAGAANDRPTLEGVGIGLAAQTTYQFVSDGFAGAVARTYLGTLKPAPGGLVLRF